MKNKNFLLPVSRYAILDIRKGKAIEAALPTMFFLLTSTIRVVKASRQLLGVVGGYFFFPL